MQEAKKDKERRIQATLRCTKEIDSLMGQSKDAISWPSTENDLFWSTSLSPFYKDYRELRAARHRKEEVPRCWVEVKHISSASSNRLSWDPVEDCLLKRKLVVHSLPDNRERTHKLMDWSLGINPSIENFMSTRNHVQLVFLQSSDTAVARI